jgi:hypothetical protein
VPITYDECGVDVNELVQQTIKKHHPDLEECEASVMCLFADSGEAGVPAVKWHGYPAAAVIKKTSLKDRAQGMKDALITIDRRWWDDAYEDERAAVIDHELTHLEVVRDEQGAIESDDQGRPKFKLKLHDWQLGGFAVIAKRHGDAAPEVQMAKEFRDKYGQLLMWAEEKQAVG